MPETNSMYMSTLSDETLKYRHPHYTGSPFRSEVRVQGYGRWCKTKQKPFHVTSPMFALLGCKVACCARHARKMRLGERPCHPIITLFNSIKKKKFLWPPSHSHLQLHHQNFRYHYHSNQSHHHHHHHPNNNVTEVVRSPPQPQ